MSALLDFSDDFRPDPRSKTISKSAKSLAQVVEERRDTTEKENCSTLNRNAESNSSYCSNMSNILKQIGTIASSLGLSLDNESISTEVVLCFEKAIQENDRGRSQLQELLDENQSIRLRCVQLEKDQEKLKAEIEAAHQEVASHSNRTTALQAEYRDMRNHWLCEKNELEGKYFQIQALLTQTKAVNIKKEKGTRFI
jgi:hypothetical protein